MLLYQVEAPLLDRFTRFQNKYGQSDFKEFAQLSDDTWFEAADDRDLKIIKTIVNKGTEEHSLKHLNE